MVPLLSPLVGREASSAPLGRSEAGCSIHKSSYWIKLYHEILVDPKMGTLDNLTWRRAIELFLIAGDHNQAGLLPAIAAIAWTLHTTPDEIQAILLALEEIGVASRDESGDWRVTNFARRQGVISGADRSRAFRNRRKDRDDDRDDNRSAGRDANRDEGETKRRASVTDPETKSARDKDSDTDKDTDTDSDPDTVCDSHTPGQNYFARVYKSQPTPSQLLTLAQLEKTHGYYRLSQVIDWAVSSGIPPGRALRAIRTAITAWSDHLPPPPRAGRDHRTGAIEKLRRKYGDGLDT